MLAVAPAVCSLVCAVVVLFLVRSFRNSTETRLHFTYIAYSLIVSALWFALLGIHIRFEALPMALADPTSSTLPTLAHLSIMTSAESGSLFVSAPTATMPIKIALSIVAYGVAAVVFALRSFRARGGFAVGNHNQLNHKQLLSLAIIHGVLLAEGIALAFVGSDPLWGAMNVVFVSAGQVLYAYLIVRRQYLRYGAATQVIVIGSSSGNSGNKGGDNNPDQTATKLQPTKTTDTQTDTPTQSKATPAQPQAGAASQTKPPQTKPPQPQATPTPSQTKLTRRDIEAYFYLHRPFVDPAFKLSDLAEAMRVNRSEMSAFINSTFGVNFRRYVNRWRLQEYERLMALPSNEVKNPSKILLMAGFADLRHYLRVLEQEKEAAE
jgi:AraC-like DNA-binding protein